MELLLAGHRLLLLFPLAQDRSSFLRELRLHRASLEGLKMVALPGPHQGKHTQGENQLPAADTLQPGFLKGFTLVPSPSLSAPVITGCGQVLWPVGTEICKCM